MPILSNPLFDINYVCCTNYKNFANPSVIQSKPNHKWGHFNKWSFTIKYNNNASKSHMTLLSYVQRLYERIPFRHMRLLLIYKSFHVHKYYGFSRIFKIPMIFSDMSTRITNQPKLIMNMLKKIFIKCSCSSLLI